MRRRADHHGRAVDHAGCTHVDHDRAGPLAPRDHRIPVPPRTGGAQRHPLAARRRLAAARPCARTTPARLRGQGGSRRDQSDVPHHRVHRRAPARCRVPRLADHRDPRASTCARSSRPGPRSSTPTTRGSTRLRTRTDSSRRTIPPSSRPSTGWWASCSMRCPTTPRWWSPPTTARCTSGPRDGRASRPSTRWSTPTRATGGSATCTHDRGRRPTSSRRHVPCTATTPGSSAASSCSTRAGSGPTRSRPRTGGSAMSSGGARRRRLRRPHPAVRGATGGRPRVAHPGGDAGAAGRLPRSGSFPGDRLTHALSSRTTSV